MTSMARLASGGFSLLFRVQFRFSARGVFSLQFRVQFRIQIKCLSGHTSYVFYAQRTHSINNEHILSTVVISHMSSTPSRTRGVCVRERERERERECVCECECVISLSSPGRRMVPPAFSLSKIKERISQILPAQKIQKKMISNLLQVLSVYRMAVIFLCFYLK